VFWVVGLEEEEMSLNDFDFPFVFGMLEGDELRVPRFFFSLWDTRRSCGLVG
jgi:hypothetical protein